MNDYLWTTLVVPEALVPAARAAWAGMSETPAGPGRVLTVPLNATGSPADPPTHRVSWTAVGPEGRATLPGLKADLPGSDYTEPAPAAAMTAAGVALLNAVGLKPVDTTMPTP